MKNGLMVIAGLVGVILATGSTANQPLKLKQDKQDEHRLFVAKFKAKMQYLKDIPSARQTNKGKATKIFIDIVKMGKGCFWANIQSSGEATRYYNIYNSRVSNSHSVIPINCIANRRKNKQYQLQQNRHTKRI